MDNRRVSVSLLKSCTFDFWDKEKIKLDKNNGKEVYDDANIFEKRVHLYNCLIEEVVSNGSVGENGKTFRDYAFIAGGFFTKYPPTSYRRQTVDIFVQYPFKCFNPEICDLKNVIRKSLMGRAMLSNARMNQVYATFDIENVNVMDPTDCVSHFYNVSVHICTCNCRSMLAKFSLKPCCIAYKYKDNRLIMSDWFANGGSMYTTDKVQPSANLLERYAEKGFTNYPIISDTAISFMIDSEVENIHIVCEGHEPSDEFVNRYLEKGFERVMNLG